MKNNYFIRSPFSVFNCTNCIVQEEIVKSNLSKPNPFPTQLHWVVLYHFLLYWYSHIHNNKRPIIVVALDSTSMEGRGIFLARFLIFHPGMNDFEVVLEMTGMERMSLFASQQSSLAVMLIYFWRQFVWNFTSLLIESTTTTIIALLLFQTW